MLNGSSGKLLTLLVLAAFGSAACSRADKANTADEGAALSRTEFTNRIENYFEFDPLRAGKKSQFLIHLTDLSDGSPVEQAEVTLTMRSQGSGAEVAQTKARVGKVTGIYVTDVVITNAGNYAIEFHVKNDKLDERMPLTDFKVE
jgi:5-hydroxyisourate hydrolase-like protein (transthyretin family)